jgi:hypothetical protein
VSERESERLVGIFVDLVLEQPRRGIKLFGGYVFRSNSKRESPGNKGKKMWRMGKGGHEEKGERGKERNERFFLFYCTAIRELAIYF